MAAATAAPIIWWGWLGPIIIFCLGTVVAKKKILVRIIETDI